MKNRTKKILTIFIMAFIIASIVTTFAIVSSATEPTPTVEIAGKNITFEESTALKFAISVENAGENEPKLLVWTAAQNNYSYDSAAAKEVAYIGSGEIAALGAGEYDQFKFPVFAKQMADVFYFRAYVEVDSVVYYSDVLEYSVLEYAYDRLINSEDANFKALLTATLDQGAAAQIYGEYNTSRLANGNWKQIKVIGNAFASGNNTSVCLLGDTFDLADSGLTSPTWQSSNSEIVAVDNGRITVMAPGVADITATTEDDTVTYKISVSSTFEEATATTMGVYDTTWTNGYPRVKDNSLVSAKNGYIYSDVITIAKAGTTIIFIDHDDGVNSNEQFATDSIYAISSWKNVDDSWALDTSGTNIKARVASLYEDCNGARVYTYTTAKDNENIRVSYREGNATVDFNATKVATIYYIEPAN